MTMGPNASTVPRSYFLLVLRRGDGGHRLTVLLKERYGHSRRSWKLYARRGRVGVGTSREGVAPGTVNLAFDGADANAFYEVALEDEEDEHHR